MGVYVVEAHIRNSNKLKTLIKWKNIKIIKVYAFTDQSIVYIKIRTTERMFLSILKRSTLDFCISGREESLPELQKKITKLIT
jgi:hypothetical protein